MFNHVIKCGHLIKCDGLSLSYATPSLENDRSRIGFIIRKSTGKAVFRNYLKRTIREIFKEREADFSGKKWIVLKIPSGPIKVPVKELVQGAIGLLKNL
jgi:ribonuclease P protein component